MSTSITSSTIVVLSKLKPPKISKAVLTDIVPAAVWMDFEDELEKWAYSYVTIYPDGRNRTLEELGVTQKKVGEQVWIRVVDGLGVKITPGGGGPALKKKNDDFILLKTFGTPEKPTYPHVISFSSTSPALRIDVMRKNSNPAALEPIYCTANNCAPAGHPFQFSGESAI